MPISAAEQLLIEYINRARLDPPGEADRFGISLNEGLSEGTISADPKQPLAPNAYLERAAVDHSLWMLSTDTFSHTGAGGSSAGDRMEAAGYAFTGRWGWGENISWRGTTGILDEIENAPSHHRGLFESATHRVNILDDRMSEVGIGMEVGQFSNTRVWNATMLTQKFALSGDKTFVTGVAYADHDDDAFYDPGEGIAGLRIWGEGGATTGSAGGYAVETSGDWAGLTLDMKAGRTQVWLNVEEGNAKLDIVGADRVESSTDTVVSGAVREARLLGIDDVNLTGADDNEQLHGNGGDNRIHGGAGHDALHGGAGHDTLIGGQGDDAVIALSGQDLLLGWSGHDTLDGDAGRDRLFGHAGNDNLMGGGVHDVLVGGAGADVLHGQDHRDRVYGQLGNDRLSGDSGADTLFGNRGNDILLGDGGADVMRGGLGDDTLEGGAGNDSLSGNAGADTFIFSDGFGRDRIWGVEVSGPERDTLRLEGAGEARSLREFRESSRQSENGVVYDAGNDGANVIELYGLTLADLGGLQLELAG